MTVDHKMLEQVSDDNALLEVARRAIEDNLIEMRDARISILGRNNGLGVKEGDGT